MSIKVLIAFLFLISVSFATAIWNDSYTIGIPINFTTTSYSQQNATFGAYLNLPQMTAGIGGTTSNGSDIRTVCNYSGTLLEEPHWLRETAFNQSLNSSFNISNRGTWNYTSGTGDIYMMVNETNATARQCWIFLQASTLVADSSNISNTFIYGDNFKSNTMANYNYDPSVFSYNAQKHYLQISYGGGALYMTPLVQPNISNPYTMDIDILSQMVTNYGNWNRVAICADGQNNPGMRSAFCAQVQKDSGTTYSNDVYINSVSDAVFYGVQSAFFDVGQVPGYINTIYGMHYTVRNDTSMYFNWTNQSSGLKINDVSYDGSGASPHLYGGFFGIFSSQTDNVSMQNFRVSFQPPNTSVVFGNAFLQTAVTPSSVTLVSPTPASGTYQNSSYLYVNASVSGNFTGCNLNVNGTNYTMTINPGNFFCYLNQTYADGNYAYSVYAFNATNISTSSINTITIDATAPIITGQTPSSGVFAYLNQTFSINVTETNPASAIFQFNGTNYTMNNQSGGFYIQMNNTVGNTTYFYLLRDLANNTLKTNNYTAYFYNITNYTLFYSNPESDVSNDNISIFVKMNNIFGLTPSTTLQYNGANFTATTYSNATGQWISYYVVTPPASSTPTIVNNTWFFNLNGVIFQFPFSTSVQSGGLTYCGNLTNTTSIQYNILDSLTFTQISANLSVSISQSTALASKSGTLNIGGSNISICINPPSLYVNASLNESFTATGYVGKLVSRSISQYSANSANLTVYLVNSSSQAYFQTIINVIDNNRAPVPNVFVVISQQNVTSNTYYTIINAQTNTNGATTQLLIPNSVFYQMTVLDSSGNLLQSYSPAVISCNTLTQTVCNVVLVVGEIVSVPYISTFNYANATCSWNNVTGDLACTPIGLEINTTELSVILINQTAYNATICTQTGVGLATVTCTLPTSAGNCYNFAFRGTLNTGETPILGGGRVCISGPPSFTQNSGIGLLLAFVLLAIGAIIGLAFGAAGVLIGMAFGLMLAVAFSFVTGIAWYGAIGAIAALLTAAWVVK